MDDDFLIDALRAWASSPDREQATIERALRDSLARIRAVVEAAERVADADDVAGFRVAWDGARVALAALLADDRRLLGME